MSDYVRSITGMKPQVRQDVEDLQRQVSALQARAQEQQEKNQLDGQLTSKDIKGLKKRIVDLDDRTSTLEDNAAKDSGLGEYKEQSKSKKTLEKPAPTRLTVAAIRRVVAEGGWVILHGQCWRKEGEKKEFILVSDEEMKDNQIYWRDLRGLTDEELKKRYNIVRGGCEMKLKGKTRGVNVPEEEMEKARRLYMAARREAGEETNSDPESSSSDEEPDLRRQQRRLSSDKDTSDAAEADEVKVTVIICDEGHQMRQNTSSGLRTCVKCEAYVPRLDQFFRCGICDWNLCFDCVPR
jgi:hypothetical protein